MAFQTPLSSVRWLIICCLLGASMAQAACPSVATAQRFTVNGAEVTDKETGLIWARCSVGQAWNGSTCAGSATGHWHETALTLAKQTKGWRLPNVKELGSLIDEGCQFPAIDSAAFPNTPSAYYWSSSHSTGNNGALYVVFSDGAINYEARNLNYGVRLVRSTP